MRSLRTQLLISHLLLVLVMGAVMSLSITSLFSLLKTVERLSQNNLKSVIAAYNIQDALQHIFASAELARSQPNAARRPYASSRKNLLDGLDEGDKAADSDEDHAIMQALRRN